MLQGQTITFLDAHCECAEGWLQPLLQRVAENRYAVPSPTIDIIDENTFKYTPVSFKVYGGCSKKFVFEWQTIPQREWNRIGPAKTEPLVQPTMAGGLFTIDRDFFYEIGAFDEGMQIWGGENVELSFRVRSQIDVILLGILKCKVAFCCRRSGCVAASWKCLVVPASATYSARKLHTNSHADQPIQ